MKPFLLGSSVLAAFALGILSGSVACTTAEPPPRTPEAATILRARTNTTCPLGVRDAHVAVDDTIDGIALTFTATTDRLGELRERAADAAAMHGPGQGLGKGHDGRHGTGGEHGLKAMQLPPADAGEQDIDGGARIYLRPADPKDLATLRMKVRERAEAMMASCY
jgi:hypothetical protein